MNDEGSHIGTFEAQSPGLEAGCLRFAGWVAPPLRKTRFQVVVALSWAGLVTRRVSSKGFEVFPTSQPPFPSLLGAIPFSSCRIAFQMVAGRQVFRHPGIQGRHYILDK